MCEVRCVKHAMLLGTKSSPVLRYSCASLRIDVGHVAVYLAKLSQKLCAGSDVSLSQTGTSTTFKGGVEYMAVCTLRVLSLVTREAMRLTCGWGGRRQQGHALALTNNHKPAQETVTKKRSTSRSKPMSNILSASSSTNICTQPSDTQPSSTRSSRRPGVATSTRAVRHCRRCDVDEC
jgi:hypothetical protein